MMEEIECFNLCDMEEQIYEHMKCGENAMYATNVKRIYIGSYFCANYFIQLDIGLLDNLLEQFCRSLGNQVSMTLVVPILDQSRLQKGKEKIKQVCAHFSHCMDEITVNEYGILPYVQEQTMCRINIGRLMLKDNRDPRVDDFYEQCVEPKLFTKMFVDMLGEFRVKCVELDEIHKELTTTKLPAHIEVAVHIPYMYISTGHICEIASHTKEDSKKFRAGDRCSLSCKSFHIGYEETEKLSYVKLGKGVYVKRGSRTKLITKHQVRTIYMPLDLL